MPKLRVKPAEPAHPHVTEFLYPLVAHYRGLHREYRQNAAARTMGLSPTGLSAIINGLNRPTPEECLLIAHYYGFPVEQLLHAAGYPIVKDLIAFALTLSPKTDEGKADKEFMTRYLRKALEPDWQNMSAAAPFKAGADIVLTRGDLSLYAKARGYAEAVYFYELDKGRLMRSGEFSSLALQTVS